MFANGEKLKLTLGNTKDKDNDLLKSGAHSISCGDCNGVYYGQTRDENSITNGKWQNSVDLIVSHLILLYPFLEFSCSIKVRSACILCDELCVCGHYHNGGNYKFKIELRANSILKISRSDYRLYPRRK